MTHEEGNLQALSQVVLNQGRWPVCEALQVRAWRKYAGLAATATNRRLLHGDLQHYTILQGERRGWVAIDPKGVVGALGTRWAPPSGIRWNVRTSSPTGR